MISIQVECLHWVFNQQSLRKEDDMQTAEQMRTRTKSMSTKEKERIEKLDLINFIEISIMEASDNCKYVAEMDIDLILRTIESKIPRYSWKNGDQRQKLYNDQLLKLGSLGYTVISAPDGESLLISWCEK